MAEKMKPDKLMLDVRQADAAGLSYGRWRFEETERMLNVFSVDETYEDETGKSARYFPATAAMVTAPDCGHMMYGSITQMDYGKTDYTTYAAKRVAKLVVDQDKDTRKLRLGCRPLAAPKTYCPYIYAADVVG